MWSELPSAALYLEVLVWAAVTPGCCFAPSSQLTKQVFALPALC